MRFKSLVIWALVASVCVAQVPLTPPVTSAVGESVVTGPLDLPAVEPVPTPNTAPLTLTLATTDVSPQHVTTLEMIRTEIQNSDGLSRIQKFRALRRLKRPKVALRVVDEVTARAMDAGYVVVEMDENDDVTTQVNWEGITELIKVLMPFIIQLIGLFG